MLGFPSLLAIWMPHVSPGTPGRCEACSGDGTIKIEMNFLPDVYAQSDPTNIAHYSAVHTAAALPPSSGVCTTSVAVAETALLVVTANNHVATPSALDPGSDADTLATEIMGQLLAASGVAAKVRPVVLGRAARGASHRGACRSTWTAWLIVGVYGSSMTMKGGGCCGLSAGAPVRW